MDLANIEYKAVRFLAGVVKILHLATKNNQSECRTIRAEAKSRMFENRF
jgi:hypothetical protein